MATRVVRVMGTVVSIDVRDPVAPTPTVERAVDDVVAWLHEVDARFSPFREDSEIRRLDRGELTLEACHPDVRHVLRACDALRAETGGAFDAHAHHPDGQLDPSGFVKGWAVDEAGDRLVAAGVGAFAINAGGDILVRGTPDPDRPWRVGIRDPRDAGRVAAVLRIESGAVATSGLYERGAHVHDPRTGAVPGAWTSVTVVGTTLGIADAWATAALVLGPAGPARVAARPGLGVLALAPDGTATWSERVTPLLA